METPKCLICRKEIEVDEHNTFAGGDVVISFGYGGRHDQCGGHPNGLRCGTPALTPLEQLLQCDRIYARMCDDCFEEVYPLFEGYMVTKEIKEERVV